MIWIPRVSVALQGIRRAATNMGNVVANPCFSSMVRACGWKKQKRPGDLH